MPAANEPSSYFIALSDFLGPTWRPRCHAVGHGGRCDKAIATEDFFQGRSLVLGAPALLPSDTTLERLLQLAYCRHHQGARDEDWIMKSHLRQWISEIKSLRQSAPIVHRSSFWHSSLSTFQTTNTFSGLQSPQPNDSRGRVIDWEELTTRSEPGPSRIVNFSSSPEDPYRTIPSTPTPRTGRRRLRPSNQESRVARQQVNNASAGPGPPRLHRGDLVAPHKNSSIHESVRKRAKSPLRRSLSPKAWWKTTGDRRGGYVYMLKAINYDGIGWPLFKVGSSYTPALRARSLNTAGCKYFLEPEPVCERRMITSFSRAESLTHTLFENEKVPCPCTGYHAGYTEFFKVNPDILHRAIRTMTLLADYAYNDDGTVVPFWGSALDRFEAVAREDESVQERVELWSIWVEKKVREFEERERWHKCLHKKVMFFLGATLLVSAFLKWYNNPVFLTHLLILAGVFFMRPDQLDTICPFLWDLSKKFLGLALWYFFKI